MSLVKPWLECFYLAAEYALKLTHINLASLNKINDSIYFLEF